MFPKPTTPISAKPPAHGRHDNQDGGINAGRIQRAPDLLQKAPALSKEERADLAWSLIGSLDTAVEEGAEEAWSKEITSRMQGLESGMAKNHPVEASSHSPFIPAL